MKPVLFVLLMVLLMSCRMYGDIQVHTAYAEMERKEVHMLGDDQIVIQYWRDDLHGLLYVEWLPYKDTGYAVGTKALILVKR